uniref:Uncharacterized protein n=1 Tax=Globodera rostochiensis TaxID=31243 RepID=A0A914HZ52_GLORO
MKQLLIELGASQSETQRAMPAITLKKRLAAATAVAVGTARQSTAEPKRQRKEPQQQEEEDLDLRDIKRIKLDEDEYDDGIIDLYKQLDDPDSASAATQKAIDITTDFVLERLSIHVVTKLVMISLYTLPDKMPAAFASSYTPIDEAGSQAQKRHLARMMAIQMTREGEGPGIQYIKAEKQKLFMERQAARSAGAIIPPTPFTDRSGAAASTSAQSPNDGSFAQPQLPVQKKVRPQNWNLFNSTRELLPKEAEQMTLSTFQRILDSEKRAVQGGAGLAQQKIIVRLVTRFKSNLSAEVEAILQNYIIEDQKSRADLALLWLAELFVQWMGSSSSNTSHLQLTVEERKERYDSCLCSLLSTLYERGEHKETLFHRIFLEAAYLTPTSLKILRKACLDKVYGAFAMTTLRELILTRVKQRQTLLRVLMEFNYFERNDIKEQCVKTVKELFQLDFLRGDPLG